MNATSASASRHSPWQNPRRRRQVAAGAGILLLGYLVLVMIALLGGPRIGASVLPLPGRGPQPAHPVAGPEPGQPTQELVIPHGSTPTPAVTPTVAPTTAVPTLLPTATTPGEVQLPSGVTTTPCPSTPPPGSATPELAESTAPPLPPATRRPPVVPPTQPPADPTTQPPTSKPPTKTPTTRPTSPTTSPPTTKPPTTPEDPDHPTGLTGFLGNLLHKLGL